MSEITISAATSAGSPAGDVAGAQSPVAGGCCDTSTLSSCCQASAKSACCGAPAEQLSQAPSSCGCSN